MFISRTSWNLSRFSVLNNLNTITRIKSSNTKCSATLNTKRIHNDKKTYSPHPTISNVHAVTDHETTGTATESDTDASECNGSPSQCDIDTSGSRSSDRLHISVLKNEMLQYISPKNGQIILDMTFGAGGHTKAILEEAPGCTIFCLDRDPEAYHLAEQLSKKSPSVVPLLGTFSEVHQLLEPHNVTFGSVDTVIFDCGVSSMQFDSGHRGFTLSQDVLLDMRMDGNRYPDQPTAKDVVNNLDESGLYKILKKYGEEKRARIIAQTIVDTRYAFGPIETTKQLANIVASVYNVKQQRDKLSRPSHVATKTFQALRIFVNNELNELNNGLEIAWHLLKENGVCAAISFHSLEDRIVKRHFHNIDMDKKFNMSVGDQSRNYGKTYSQDFMQNIVYKKWEPKYKNVIIPSEEELISNPRSRSAKLRAASKVK